MKKWYTGSRSRQVQFVWNSMVYRNYHKSENGPLREGGLFRAVVPDRFHCNLTSLENHQPEMSMNCTTKCGNFSKVSVYMWLHQGLNLRWVKVLLSRWVRILDLTGIIVCERFNICFVTSYSTIRMRRKLKLNHVSRNVAIFTTSEWVNRARLFSGVKGVLYRNWKMSSLVHIL